MPRPRRTLLYTSVLALVRAVARYTFSFSRGDVVGIENIPEDGGFVLASNHASHLDPPILAAASPRQLTYIAKIELFRNPAFSWFIRRLGAHPVERGAGDRETLATAVRLLREGHGVVVYPEGTRTLTGRLGKIRSGAVLLASEAEVPLVPAYISGTFRAWPKGGRIRPHPVRVAIGRALDPADFVGPGARKKMQSALAAALEEMESGFGETRG